MAFSLCLILSVQCTMMSVRVVRSVSRITPNASHRMLAQKAHKQTVALHYYFPKQNLLKYSDRKCTHLKIKN